MTVTNDNFSQWRPKTENNIQKDSFSAWRPKQEEQIQEEPKEESLPQKIASSFPVQAVLGTFKRFTWPLDLLKMAALAEGVSGAEEIEEAVTKEGGKFDKDYYLKKVFEAAQALPTQDAAEEFIKEQTGLDLSPKGTAANIFRKAGEIGSLSPGKIAGAPIKEIAKKSTGALTGGTVSTGLEELGVPGAIAEPIGFGFGGAATAGKKITKPLAGEAAKARETAGKFGLRRFEGMEREKPPKNPIVSVERQKELGEELSKSSKDAIEQIIRQEIPIKKMKEKGYDLKKSYQKLYKVADKEAKISDKEFAENLAKKKAEPNNKEYQKLPVGIDIEPVLTWIKSEKAKILKSAPSLSKPDQVKLNILNKEYRQLTKNKEKIPEPKVKLLGPSGDLLKPAIKQPRGREQKIISATQSIDQKRNFNENVKDLYRKTEFTGAEQEVKETYAQMGQKLIESIEKSGDMKLAENLRFGDRIFSENAKLNLVEDVIGKSFENGYDPKKLSSVLKGNKNQAMLNRSIGKDAVKDLKDIASYGEKANSMVLSKLKNPATVGDWFKELTPLKLAIVMAKHTGLPIVGSLHEIAKGTSNRIQGYLFTRNSTKKAYVDFLKGAASGEKGAFAKASKNLTDAINEEFGNEEELEKLSKEKD